MNYELCVLSRILQGSAPDTEYKKVYEAEYSGKVFLVYRDQFEFIKRFKDTHGKVPDIDTFTKKFKDTELPIAKEPSSFYIEELKKQFVYQNMSRISGEVISLLSKSQAVKAMEFVSSELMKIKQIIRTSRDVDLAADVNNRLTRYNDRRKMGAISGIPCGWSKIDLETSGWQDGELTILAGRPGSYKSWLLVLWSLVAWEAGYNVLFFSKEMPETQVFKRLDALITKTRFKDLKTGTLTDVEYDAFKSSLLFKLQQDPFRPFYKVIDNYDTHRYDVDCVREKIKEYRPDIIFVDGVYLFNAEGNSEWEKQTNISRKLKGVAKDERKPIVGTIQLSKKMDIAYSDSWNQDADNILHLHRMWDKVIEDYTNQAYIKGTKFREAENMYLAIEVDLDAMEIAELGSDVSLVDDTEDVPTPF